MATVLSLLITVFIAPRCFADDSNVQTMSGYTVAKFMLRKEERRRPEARGFHSCVRGLSLLPASVTLLHLRPKAYMCV